MTGRGTIPYAVFPARQEKFHKNILATEREDDRHVADQATGPAVTKPTIFRECKMANPRQQERPFESSTEQAERKIADETNRVTRNVADFGEHAARTNVDMIQGGMETARHFWQSTAELTSSIASRATDQFGRALGAAGGETEATAQQSSRNLTAIMQSSHSLNEGFRKVSDEWFKFVRTRMERTFEHTDKVLRSRSPQEFAAAQTEAMRDHLEALVQSTQRIAQVSQQVADEASLKLSDAARRAA